MRGWGMTSTSTPAYAHNLGMTGSRGYTSNASNQFHIHSSYRSTSCSRLTAHDSNAVPLTVTSLLSSCRRLPFTLFTEFVGTFVTLVEYLSVHLPCLPACCLPNFYVWQVPELLHLQQFLKLDHLYTVSDLIHVNVKVPAFISLQHSSNTFAQCTASA